MSSSELKFNRIDNSSKIDSNFAAELRSEYDRFVSIFGEIPSLRGINVARYDNDNIFGIFNDNSREITIMGVGGKNGRNFITQIAVQNKKNGQWSTSSPLHSYRHELGHALQEELRINDPLWETKKAEIEEIKKSLLDTLTNLENSAKIEFKKNKLSVYGFVDTNEFISECIAEYANSPKKARSTAKKVVEILLRKGD